MVEKEMGLRYKMTEIGEIPEEWDILPLTKVAKYINGMAFKPSDWKKQGIPIVRIENLNDSSAPFNYFDEEVDNKFLLNDGDILLSWSASLGVYIWNRGKAVLNQHIFKVVPNETVNKYYLFWALHNSVETLSKVTHGSTMKHFQKGELERTKIALPSLSEQQKIAEILSDLDDLIESLDALLSKKKNIKQGLMQKLLTRGIGHIKFKMTEIGEIPEEWEVSSINKTSLLKGRIGWQGLTTKEYLKNGEYYLVSGTEFKDGTIDWLKCNFVSKERYNQDSNIQVKINDLLVTKDGTIGKVAFVESLILPATLNSGVFVIRPLNNSYYPKFLYYILQSKYFKRFIGTLKAGSTISHLYQYSFSNFAFPNPPLLEQQKIAEILSDVDSEIEALEQKRDKYKLLKMGMMRQLLTGRIRVK